MAQPHGRFEPLVFNIPNRANFHLSSTTGHFFTLYTRLFKTAVEKFLLMARQLKNSFTNKPNSNQRLKKPKNKPCHLPFFKAHRLSTAYPNLMHRLEHCGQVWDRRWKTYFSKNTIGCGWVLYKHNIWYFIVRWGSFFLCDSCKIHP